MVKVLVQSYLKKKGVVEPRFEDNWPGKDWLRSFMTRNRLTKRICDNVKASRAEVSRATGTEFFSNLGTVMVDGVSPDCIFNYDETNMTDDPGSSTLIVRRGLRTVEWKIDHSKSSISVMFSGSADGTFLPPFIVYKAKNLYWGWTLNGPAGASYDVTPSGWFDQRTFEQ